MQNTKTTGPLDGTLDGPRGAAYDTRVILVGRTGLDAQLRREPGVELIRVRTPLEAIAELVGPVDSFSAGRTVVLVGSECAAQMGAMPGKLSNAADDATFREFVGAIKDADSGARVVLVSGDQARATHPLFDDATGEHADQAGLRAVVLGRATMPDINGTNNPRAARLDLPAELAPYGASHSHGRTPVATATSDPFPAAREDPLAMPAVRPGSHVVSTHAPSSSLPGPHAEPHASTHRTTPPPLPVRAESIAGGAIPASGLRRDGASTVRAPLPAAGFSEQPLAWALAHGIDITPGAIAAIRDALRDASVEFVAGSASVPVAANAASAGWQHAPVVTEAGKAGVLRAAMTHADGLRPHAAWLAQWLTLQASMATLRDEAYKDSLTGAWNRRYFDKFLFDTLRGARENRRFVTVMVFDIDDFKMYNDRYGHGAGDEILVQTVQLLSSVLRPTDRVCRIGGDEFAVVFHDPQGPRTDGSKHPESVFGIAQRFQAQLRTHRFPKLTQQAPGVLTISGGLATFPWDGATPAELLARADQLALASKRQGKNALTYGR